MELEPWYLAEKTNAIRQKLGRFCFKLLPAVAIPGNNQLEGQAPLYKFAA
jgi:hypothetical protein